jgi:drug/metabolite transporter (DMT)-like permease
VTGVLLALGAACCYGLSNFVGPQIAQRLPVMAVVTAGQVVALVVSAFVVVVNSGPVPGGDAIGAGVLAGIGNAGGVALFYAAVQSGPLSIVTPIGSTGAIVPVAIGIGTGDKVGAAGLVGIVLAIGGVALAARRRAGDDLKTAADLRRAVVLSVLSAGFFGVFLWGMDPAADDGVFWAVMISRLSLVALLVGGAVLFSRALLVRPRDLPAVALPGVLLFCGTMMYSAATTEGQISVVSVIGTLFPVVTVTLALVFLHERLSRVQWTGVCAALCGVVLLSLAQA